MSSLIDSSLDGLDPVVVHGVPGLRGRRFLEPRHLVGLAATARRLGLAPGPRPTLVVDDPDAARYAARMHLDRVLDAVGCGHGLAPVRERRLGDRLLEVTEVVEPDQVRRLGALVRRRLRGHDPEVLTALYDAVTELGLNVYVHAEPGRGRHATGYAAAQTMTRTHEIVFAIADHGVGMLGTLRRRGADDDRAAIAMGLDGASRFGEGPRGGHGLQTTARLVTGLGGSLYVASGATSVRVDARRRRWAVLRRPYTGTLLQARVPMA